MFIVSAFKDSTTAFTQRSDESIALTRFIKGPKRAEKRREEKWEELHLLPLLPKVWRNHAHTRLNMINPKT